MGVREYGVTLGMPYLYVLCTSQWKANYVVVREYGVTLGMPDLYVYVLCTTQWKNDV